MTEVILQDISRHGVQISHHEGMARDKQFVLVLPLSLHTLRLTCAVRHCEMIKQHLFQIGAEFQQIEAAR